MKTLVLGGTGFIGRVVAARFANGGTATVTVGARRAASIPGCAAYEAVDATNADSLSRLFDDADVVVNCVTGSARTIRDNAAAVAQAARRAARPIRIIQLSSMSVYGSMHGTIEETSKRFDGCSWYGRAKADAEESVADIATVNGPVTILRPGCVYGPGSPLWVDRVGLLLRAGRLGDLGPMGDGWSNLVHVDDVAKAVQLSSESNRLGVTIYNLAAPDSPRWNVFFRDFALGLGCVPFRQKTQLAILLECRGFAPPLKLLERAADHGLLSKSLVPHSIPPSLLRLWGQHIRLDCRRVECELGLRWTAYQVGLRGSIEYFTNHYGK